MTVNEEDLHERGVDLVWRLSILADRLQQTAAEVQELAEAVRRKEQEDRA